MARSFLPAPAALPPMDVVNRMKRLAALFASLNVFASDLAVSELAAEELKPHFVQIGEGYSAASLARWVNGIGLANVYC